MHGGARSLACSAGQWPGPNWLARRWRRARVKLERALRGVGQQSHLQAKVGARLLVTCAAAVGATAIPDMPNGQRPQAEPTPGTSGDREQGSRPPKSGTDLGHPKRRVTDVFLALNTFLFFLNWLLKDTLNVEGVKCNPLIDQGEYHRLITPMFLHLTPWHLAVNLQALNELGPYVEMTSGHARTAVVYVASGLASTLFSYLFSPRTTSLGASGAVYGLGAALAVFLMRHRSLFGPQACDSSLRSLGLTAAINAAYMAANKRLDSWGHLGGFLAGGLLASCLGPRYVQVAGEGGGPELQDRPPLNWLARRTPLVPPPSAYQALLLHRQQQLQQQQGQQQQR